MTNHHHTDTDTDANKPLVLSSVEIDKLLSMRLIANLATLDEDGSIHLMPMWFLRIDIDICFPTSRHTHKYRNLVSRPRASVMIDVSRAYVPMEKIKKDMADAYSERKITELHYKLLNEWISKPSSKEDTNNDS